MKLKTFIISATIAIAIAAGLIWNIIDNYYERQPAQKVIPETKEVVMYKNESCQCCDRWASYMEHFGFQVETKLPADLAALKRSKGVPAGMQACHTALVDGYVVEGHVPAEDVAKLLSLRPNVIGISVPGMPASSPGMNTAPNQPFDVYLIKNDGSKQLFASH